MSIQSDKFRTKKLDQSPYLFHFIKGTKTQALNILKKILEERKLKSMSNNYICFTASPITQIGDFFDTKVLRTNEPMYQPIGIGFSRDILIRDYQAKNVIYGDDADGQVLNQCGLGWRFLKLDVDSYDYEYLREWRVPQKEFDFSTFPIDEIVVITPTREMLIDIVAKTYCVESFDYDEETGEKYPDWVEMYDRVWKGVSLEDIKSNEFVTDYKVLKEALTQRIGEDMANDVDEIISEKIRRLNEIVFHDWQKFINGGKV